ncbi:pyruvate dehydrogenase (acetyl-transferring), homodimeric type [Halomonas eurihalina]|uniref:Pyruvate dehydrogenase E1 component n=1 Tax=Halomonas eurihalina TaxID=42566 RepID=A0A5D9DA19_HALER|nr:pyruvate dehydrogenase (acetyl-transferring), homodimeric type [Halomonas eurihalina]MDR5858576.1 pyruvate dehydrogenase (acetyl-transferring), homodimeric type [Halomonas eurihalina]TZG40764.1 pyruvate dehydrogenase (acetyl-transferring), homodimeric type [Halomonas eurihalina]
MNKILEEVDKEETREWLDALESVIRVEGVARAEYIIRQLLESDGASKINKALLINSPHSNTIPKSEEPDYPGDLLIEKKIRSAIRWNGIAMVVRANSVDKSLGGHLASYMSSATLYEVGFNHYFKAPSLDAPGDLVYFQGHIAPGIYARSFLEGRLTIEQLDNFRQEVTNRGLPSYPHPYLMPDYWQFSTVSMGLGPIQAIYQARLLKYLENRNFVESAARNVWAFLGDGECDEVETLGALNLASREKLDNLIFVINCNLQRLDGPVRGNSRVMDELESSFLGAGWNVIKVVWGSNWDPLFESDENGLLQQCMNETVDGEYQNFRAQDGGYIREKFFGKYPELLELVSHMSDEDIYSLKRGGHDSVKINAAYSRAVNKKNGRPTVILAHTVKGYAMGSEHGEADMEAHNIKTMNSEALKQLRDRLSLPISDDELDKGMPYYSLEESSEEIKYLHDRREKLGGYLPQRNTDVDSLPIPELNSKVFQSQLKGTGSRKVSTTMSFVRILSGLAKEKRVGERVVPIVPDEARTFGMEGMFRQLGIYASEGQKYEPADVGQIMYYKEDKKGQILEEGITEAGSMSSWIAAGTSHANHAVTLIPFYVFYAMFGLQRIGDLAWAAGDMLTKGFLIAGTAGRTTINGEGLQHQDGSSHIQATQIPNCKTYDPTFNYELAVIIQNGLKRMYQENINEFYYITVMNENYEHPEMPEGCEMGIMKGMYRIKKHEGESRLKANLLSSGTILNEAIAASLVLKNDFDIESNVWSVTSFNELRREAQEYDRQVMRDADCPKSKPWIVEVLKDAEGVFVAATDYTKMYVDQVRKWIPDDYYVLGTDGFGRSDRREALRHFFEIDRYHISAAVIFGLYNKGEVTKEFLETAYGILGISKEKISPVIS